MPTFSLQNRKTRGRGQGYQSVAESAFHKMKTQLQTNGNPFNADTASKMISMEGFDDIKLAEVNDNLENLLKSITSIAMEAYDTGRHIDSRGHKIEGSHTAAQIQAAALAHAYAQAPQDYLRAGERSNSLEKGEILMSVEPGVERLRASLEAYDEKENRNVALYSATFNLMAAHQDEFGEAFYPTVVVPIDQTGFSIATRITRVIKDIRRDQSGAVNNLEPVNIVKAVVDPTILRNDITNLVPVVRAESEQYFVDPAALAPTNIEVDGSPVSTAPLLMGAEFSLLGISQTDAELQKGVQDISDAVDTSIYLKNLYMNIGTGGTAELINLSVRDLPLSAFNFAVQGNYRDMVLNFSTDFAQINKDTKQADGTASLKFAPIQTGDLSVRLKLRVFGKLNCQTGTIQLNSVAVTVASIRKAGQLLDLTAGEGATAKAIFNGASLVGYDVEARRTNSNIRNRGQLLDNTWQYQTYPLPILPPISILHPMAQGDANDAADLASLITAARITASNSAVTALFRARDVLAQAVSNLDSYRDQPELFGAASYFVKAYFKTVNFDALEVVDSLKSSERAADIRGAIINMLRSEVYNMYRDSNYKAAADARAGGPSPTPTVIIGTDPVIARWIMVEGDLRTLGPDFNFKLVVTLDERMIGKMFVSFGNFDGNNQGVPDFLHFGNMGWRSELVLTLPISRNNQISKELVVQPSFQHVNHLPILLEVNVTNLEEAAENKISINVTTSDAP